MKSWPLLTHKFAMLRWIGIVSIAIFIGFGWNLYGLTHVSQQLKSKHDNRVLISQVRLSRGVAGRSLIQQDEEDLVILHLPPFFVPRHLLWSEHLDTYLNPQADGIPECERLGLHQEPVGSQWYTCEETLSDLSTFNCATYALGDVVGLSKSDWLELHAHSWTNGSSPTQVVLKNHYQLIASIPWTQDTVTSADLESYVGGDVILFVAPHGYLHVGRILGTQRGNVLVSKLGDGPLVRGSVSATARHYQNRLSEIHIYRPRSNRVSTEASSSLGRALFRTGSS